MKCFCNKCNFHGYHNTYKQSKRLLYRITIISLQQTEIERKKLTRKHKEKNELLYHRNLNTKLEFKANRK